MPIANKSAIVIFKIPTDLYGLAMTVCLESLVPIVTASRPPEVGGYMGVILTKGQDFLVVTAAKTPTDIESDEIMQAILERHNATLTIYDNMPDALNFIAEGFSLFNVPDINLAHKACETTIKASLGRT